MVAVETYDNKLYVSYLYPMLAISKNRHIYFMSLSYHANTAHLWLMSSILFIVIFSFRIFESDSIQLRALYEEFPSGLLLSIQGGIIFLRLHWSSKREKIWSGSIKNYKKLPIIITIDVILYPISVIIGIVYSYIYMSGSNLPLKIFGFTIFSAILILTLANALYFKCIHNRSNEV